MKSYWQQLSFYSLHFVLFNFILISVLIVMLEYYYITSLVILFSLDNILIINLDRCLDFLNIYLDMNYESFSLLLLTNILLYEGSTIIDCSLIIANQINLFLSGLMIVFTLYYQVTRHLYLIFISIFIYSFVFQIQ